MLQTKRIDYKKLNASKKFCNEDVIDNVSQELGISKEMVREVMEIQSDFLSSTIKSGGLENVIFVYLGRFRTNPRRIQKMMANSMTK